MFQLVGDVERYPEFVPLCTSLTVNKRHVLTEGEELIATMGIGHKALTDSFTTRVLLNACDYKITASYIDGPFSYLENRWQFKETAANACDVEFYISYAFKSALMGIALGPMIETAFRRFTGAFTERADQIYAISRHTPQAKDPRAS